MAKINNDNQVKPIKPSELKFGVPDVVIKAVNSLLEEKNRGKEIILKQKEVVARIRKLDPTLTPKEIFDNNYLDFESTFRKAGWNVSYDSPGWDESYEEFFKFTKKVKK